MRVMRTIALGSLAYGAYRAYKTYRGRNMTQPPRGAM